MIWYFISWIFCGSRLYNVGQIKIELIRINKCFWCNIHWVWTLAVVIFLFRNGIWFNGFQILISTFIIIILQNWALIWLLLIISFSYAFRLSDLFFLGLISNGKFLNGKIVCLSEFRNPRELFSRSQKCLLRIIYTFMEWTCVLGVDRFQMILSFLIRIMILISWKLSKLDDFTAEWIKFLLVYEIGSSPCKQILLDSFRYYN